MAENLICLLDKVGKHQVKDSKLVFYKSTHSYNNSTDPCLPATRKEQWNILYQLTWLLHFNAKKIT